MSDATLPALLSTSSAADPQLISSSTPNPSEIDAYPFLIHSQQSIINGSSPELDNGKLPRQKRKRTSPEDQVTLEAEYKRNPKPDKAARVEILKKVSLGEKEVQIWFQNRRQNTRRKTRPLLPHEIAAFGLGGMAALSSSPASGTLHAVTGDIELPPAAYRSATPNGSQEPYQSSDESQKSQHLTTSLEQRVSLKTEISQDVSLPSTKSRDMRTESQLRTNAQSHERQHIFEKSASSELLSSTLGYLSNRRNARASSFSIPKSSVTPTLIASSIQKHSPTSSCPENVCITKFSPASSSQVRLSLSLDGKAELISSQISPPRPQRTQALSCKTSITHIRSGLKRCQSDITTSNTPDKLSSHLPHIPRIPSGRSRDARTWEFCCDTDARDELTTQAENESSGSAVAAISLLRSTSTGNLKSAGSKRNAPAPKLGSMHHGKKPKLDRASSSLPRLQSNDKNLIISPSGDSDKENWLPQDASGNSPRRNHVFSRSTKQKRPRVLGELKAGLSHKPISDGNKMTCGKPVVTEVGIFEDRVIEPKTDREVDRFMRGEVSPSKKGDLDCIQGLLSLSQGTWR